MSEVPGAVTLDGPGRPPAMVHSLDDHLPARHLGGRRRKYFIGVMDPAASIEFTRGCPWDCSFCSAWTFYGRSYRRLSPEAAVREPFISSSRSRMPLRPYPPLTVANAIPGPGLPDGSGLLMII